MSGRQQQAQQIAERYAATGMQCRSTLRSNRCRSSSPGCTSISSQHVATSTCWCSSASTTARCGSWRALSVPLPAGASTTTTSQSSRTRRAHTKRDGPYGTSSSTAVDINAIRRFLQATPQRSQQTQRLSSNANPAMHRRLSRRATACCGERTASAWHPSTGPPPPRRPPRACHVRAHNHGIDPDMTRVTARLPVLIIANDEHEVSVAENAGS